MSVRGDLLAGILDALRGQKRYPGPPAWPEVFPKLLATRDPTVLERTLLLALDLGEPKAIEALQEDPDGPGDAARHPRPRLRRPWSSGACPT